MSESTVLRAWRRGARYAVFRGIEAVAAILPRRARVALACGVIRTAGFFRLNRLAMANLDRAYGDSISRDEKKRILQGLYRHLGRILVELMAYRKEGVAFAERMVETDPSVLQFHRAMEQKRGAILVTPHFSSWELIPGWIKAQGFQAVLVGKRVKDSRLNDMLMEMRASVGAQIIYHDESGRKLLRALQQNCLVGLLPDLDSTRLDGIFVPFFGRPTYTPTSPASLSIMTGAPIIPAFLVFENGKYRFVAEPAIEPSGSDRSDEEVRRLTQAWSDAFEKWIRKHPDHWMWFQRRWTTTPGNAPTKHAKRRQETG